MLKMCTDRKKHENEKTLSCKKLFKLNCMILFFLWKLRCSNIGGKNWHTAIMGNMYSICTWIAVSVFCVMPLFLARFYGFCPCLSAGLSRLLGMSVYWTYLSVGRGSLYGTCLPLGHSCLLDMHIFWSSRSIGDVCLLDTSVCRTCLSVGQRMTVCSAGFSVGHVCLLDMSVCWTCFSIGHVCLFYMFFYGTCTLKECLLWDMSVFWTYLTVRHVCLWDMSVCGTCLASIICPLSRTQYGSGDTPGRSTRRADIRAGTGFPFTIRPLHLHVVPGPPVVVFHQPFGSLEPKNSKISLEERVKMSSSSKDTKRSGKIWTVATYILLKRTYFSSYDIWKLFAWSTVYY
jgi:hypothetical protein